MLWDQDKLASGFFALKKAETLIEMSPVQGADQRRQNTKLWKSYEF